MHQLDLIIFLAYMSVLVGIGAWFTRREAGLKEYLLAGQDVHWIVVAISVLAALFSGISYIGIPAESFFYDLTMFWAVVSFLIATPIATVLFLPFFRQLGIYTAYEYLERRFDNRLRYFAAGCFILRGTCYLALAISAPGLVVSEMTGWPFAACAIGSGLAATAYTTLGGMKAVIWTDSVQFVVLCGGILVIIGCAAAGVPGNVLGAFELAAADGKMRWLNASPNPTIRVTIWGALIGGTCNNLVQLVTDQISVQRYLTARSLNEAKRALWLKLGLTLPLLATFYLAGTVLYGYYKANPDRVPTFANAKLIPGLPSGAVETAPLLNDRLLPYFVMHELPSPLPGLLIAAIVGATMAVISAGINALATTALIDFSSVKERENPNRVAWARTLTILFGLLATGVALEISRLGTMVEATNTIMGLFGGPLLGVFLLGAITERANGTAALAGALLGAIVGMLITFSKPLFDVSLSFLWITPASVLTTVVVGALAGGWLRPTRDVSAYVFSFGRSNRGGTDSPG
ncbi:MAG TPA: sodium/solute symporter [Caulifigura sp.]|nr:sodium/solute symporter [Caulifigura sp.]